MQKLLVQLISLDKFACPGDIKVTEYFMCDVHLWY